MSYLSTKKAGERVVFVLFLAITLSLTISVARQVMISLRINRSLTEKQVLLKKAEEENQELRARLKEVESRGYVEEQARKMLGLASQEPQFETERYEGLPQEGDKTFFNDWLGLFIY